MRRIQTLMTLALAASVARAGGADARLSGATMVIPTAGGLISSGGSSLRRLSPGGEGWEVLYRQKGDTLSRVAADESGRVLAAWEKDPFIRLFAPRSKEQVRLPKPSAPSPEGPLQIHDLAFSPNGHDALAYVRGADGRFAAYRVALDGKSAPELLFHVEDATLVRASRYGAVYARTRNAFGGLPLYEITPATWILKPLVNGVKVQVRDVWPLPGSDDERLVAMVVQRSGELGVLRWRHGDEDVSFRTLPPRDASSQSTGWWVAARDTDEVIELRKRGIDLEVRRYPPEGGVNVTALPAARGRDERIFGLGTRSGGGLWLHWGDRLALLDSGGAAHGFNLQGLGARPKWAGTDVYVEAPEGLWIGIEAGAGRDFARVPFDEAEQNAQPWPQP